MAKPKQERVREASKAVKFLQAQIGKYVNITWPHNKYTVAKLTDVDGHNLMMFLEGEDGRVGMIPFSSKHIYQIWFTEDKE